MLTLKKVAVTGGLSSGKTAVCNFFKQLNGYVISADELVHQLLSFSSPVGQQVAKLLGTLDRQEIADKVFSDPELLKKLEECLYPAVLEQIEKLYREAKHLNPPLFIVEVPKLFEAGMAPWFDTIVTVSTSEEKSLERYLKKGGTKQEYDRRMAHQMPSLERIKRSDYVITNNGTIAQLEMAATQLFHVLTQQELHSQ